MLVVCLVLDAAPPGLDNPVWFSAGNGSALDAFTYGPSLAPDGTWTSLAQLSLPSEELEAWEPLVCHTRPGAGGQNRSTHPLQLSGGGWSLGTFPFPYHGARICWGACLHFPQCWIINMDYHYLFACLVVCLGGGVRV